MNLELTTSRTLKISICLSITLIILGEILNILNCGTAVLYIGIFLLIISPLIGVIVSTICLSLEKDWKWVYVALILIAISAFSFVLSLIDII